MLQLHHITVHHTCMLRESQTSTQAFFIITSTIMTLISLPPYLKTIIKYQIDHSIQFTSMIVFIIPILNAHHIRTNFITKANYHAVLKDSQNNISEAWDIHNFYKIKPPPCSKKRYKWSTRAKTINLKTYQWST